MQNLVVAMVMAVEAMWMGGRDRSLQRRLCCADQPVDCFMLRGEHIGSQASNGRQRDTDAPTIDVVRWNHEHQPYAAGGG